MEATVKEVHPIDEVRLGRNFVRVGDVVRVTSSKPNRHDGFESPVKAIYARPDGSVAWYELTDPHNGGHRAIRPERIRRVAQTRAQERVR